jgi:hypothetical protein
VLGKVLAGVAVLLLLKGGRRGMPVSFARMESSSTARKYGLDNTIPPHLRGRARGLAIVAGRIEASGLKCTSFYRSPMVNAVLKFEQDNPGATPDPALLTPRNTKHAQCVALDVGSNTNGVPAPEIRRRIFALAGVAEFINPAGAGGGGLIEFDRTGSIDPNEHVHFEFDPLALEALDDGVRT